MVVSELIKDDFTFYLPDEWKTTNPKVHNNWESKAAI